MQIFTGTQDGCVLLLSLLLTLLVTLLMILRAAADCICADRGGDMKRLVKILCSLLSMWRTL